MIIESLHLTYVTGVNSPCEEEGRWEDEEDVKDKEGRKYHEASARAKYLAHDRCDIQFAVKDMQRHVFPERSRRDETEALGKMHDHSVAAKPLGYSRWLNIGEGSWKGRHSE